MSKWHQLVILLIWLLALPIAFADNRVPRVFTMRLLGEPETLDWNIAHTSVETYLLMNLMEGLVSVNQKLEVEPALAESWKLSDDRRTYTFRLKSGILWSDGMPLKAADFITSWKRLLSPTTAASYAYFLFDVEGAEDYNKGKIQDFSQVGVRATDDRTIEVRLKAPVGHWIYIPSFWVTFPLREDVVAKHGTSWPKPGRMVSLGPFTLAAHDVDRRIVLKANPSYYGRKGNLDEVNAIIIHDAATAMNLYETGKLDFMTDLSTLDLNRMRERPDLKIFPYLKTGYLGFTVSKFPVGSDKVRKAIAMAIDKTKLTIILHGAPTPATSFIPPPLIGNARDLGLKFDPKKAQALLYEAGWGPGRALEVDLVAPNWDRTLMLAQFIQAQLKEHLGASVTIQPFDHKTFRAQLDLHLFALFELSWGADFPDPDNFLSVFLGGSGNNRTNWKNAAYDELVQKGRITENRPEREKIYREAQKILLETDVAIVPLYYEPNIALVKERVKGLTLNPMNTLLLKDVDVGL